MVEELVLSVASIKRHPLSSVLLDMGTIRSPPSSNGIFGQAVDANRKSERPERSREAERIFVRILCC
jgi:hypothetical protein